MLLSDLIIRSFLIYKSAPIFEFYLKLHSTFTVTLSLPVYTYCFCLGTLLKLSSMQLFLHRYHWPIRGISTRVFMAFGTDIHAISATNVLCRYPNSWVIISAVITFYNGITHPGSFVADALLTTYHWTLYLRQLLDFPPSIYWHINWFKCDSTCSQNLVIFADDEARSGFYDFFDDDIYPLYIYPVKERNITSVE